MALVGQFAEFTLDTETVGGGWKLYHYEPGTTTLKNAWTDRTKTTTAAQPLVADANGVVSAYFDGLYDLHVYNSANVLKYTWADVFFGEPSNFGTEGNSLASATTLILGTDTYYHVTGTATIAGLSGVGSHVVLTFDSTPSLTHGATLVLRNAESRQMRSGETTMFVNDGSGVWREIAAALRLPNNVALTGRNAAGTAEVSILSVNTSDTLNLDTTLNAATNAQIRESKSSDIASATTIAAPTGNFADVTGTTTITGISTATQPGTRFSLRFTGTGLNLTHNGVSFISPWGFDYHTVQNEIIEFVSLGSGFYLFYSLNGPAEQVGQVISWHAPGSPKGFLELDGSTFSSSTYPGLFAAYGSTTLPDDRGRVEIAVDGTAGRITTASTNGGNADTLGGVGGAETHTLSTSEMPAHTHNHTAIQNVAGAIVAAGSDKGAATNATTSTGGGGAHSNTQPWIARRRFIRF